LKVESVPSGAEVTIWGESRGQTPYVATNEFKGAKVRIELAGYEPEIQTVGAGSQTIKVFLKQSKQSATNSIAKDEEKADQAAAEGISRSKTKTKGKPSNPRQKPGARRK